MRRYHQNSVPADIAMSLLHEACRDIQCSCGKQYRIRGVVPRVKLDLIPVPRDEDEDEGWD